MCRCCCCATERAAVAVNVRERAEPVHFGSKMNSGWSNGSGMRRSRIGVIVGTGNASMVRGGGDLRTAQQEDPT